MVFNFLIVALVVSLLLALVKQNLYTYLLLMVIFILIIYDCVNSNNLQNDDVIKVGSTKTDVIIELGAPSIEVKFDNADWWGYHVNQQRCTLEIRNDIVKSLKCKTI